jgi:extracellular elastinolytic metalloproteinase
MQMIRNRTFTQLLFATALCLGACATADDVDDNPILDERDNAVDDLERATGAPVSLEIGENGASRVLDMTPRFALRAHVPDPSVAAQDFLATHHAAFRLDADAAKSFKVTRVDIDHPAGGNLRHITLQREYDGIPVFQGAITVHMDVGNGVFRALGDTTYLIDRPTNRQMLEPADAVAVTTRAFGLNNMAPTFGSREGIRTTFNAPTALDPITVEPRIFQVAPGDNRYAYQTTVSWLDDNREQQWYLSLIDAQDGTVLETHNLVNTFSGLVFTRSPGVNPQTDQRVRASFDGDPTASPQGWVGAARNTSGNNVVAATDLNANNAIGTNEVQPTANANDAFDFAYNPLATAATNREAAVASLFYLINDYHDRTYRLGFTEASGNFQLNNFGRGGAQNDPVNGDAQDGSGTNNANFGTPPDGQRPRMQMFIFTINGGAQEDSDFDPHVVYHENSHGISNRLVGGGSTGCLGGIQSGGMGEGWGDFIGATFLNDPVVGAYVTGNATIGIRRASMANSPFNYGNIRTGTTQVHQVGEIWAATLWDLRNLVGAAVVEQLVVSGMKLTPCQPTMLAARNGILQADANIFAGANRCAIFQAFAGRQMGDGAVSPNHNSTTAIVTSTAVPADCNGGGGGNVVFSDDFETDKGWALAGTNTATTGQWQRANPQATNSGGVKQVDATPSGVNALVTGATAGASAGVNDIDGGETNIQSPVVAIPAGGTVTLSFSFYLAHGTNSTNADFFRVFVVNAAGAATQVFQELGAADNDNGAYVTQSVNISAFAGQSVRIRFGASDLATASLVEASVDNVEIRRQ